MILASLLLIGWSGILLGYLLGLIRPIRRARDWAHRRLMIGPIPNRRTGLCVMVLLPEVFVPLLWHRVRHGVYPEQPDRRRVPPHLRKRD